MLHTADMSFSVAWLENQDTASALNYSPVREGVSHQKFNFCREKVKFTTVPLQLGDTSLGNKTSLTAQKGYRTRKSTLVERKGLSLQYPSDTHNANHVHTLTAFCLLGFLCPCHAESFLHICLCALQLLPFVFVPLLPTRFSAPFLLYHNTLQTQCCSHPTAILLATPLFTHTHCTPPTAVIGSQPLLAARHPCSLQLTTAQLPPMPCITYPLLPSSLFIHCIALSLLSLSSPHSNPIKLLLFTVNGLCMHTFASLYLQPTAHLFAISI